MKFSITFKDPDGVSNGLREAALESVRKIEGIVKKEALALAEDREEWMTEFIKRWIAYSEYVTIEFDTDLQTATVRMAKP